ncbi:SUKH-4 family immunity protein [Yinghuangia soli]|uniref:SUKH-4 family immunity protein n=1 Tax=Yinghuangia soli TaxID=2908204 RepID=A0AA41Q9R9_9ACTN|nr:SUKH-4 family immunity protein [Yinghuangia soli]MCF2533525.1 SUKH-4 family immunity protein [Yinghuangia soli]
MSKIEPPALAAVLDEPAALLDADRAAVRAALAGCPAGEGGIGREVFAQAEAVFGQRAASRAEFASWLHFAAAVLGHGDYAARVAAAEPGLPWRTLWAWWRPVGAYEAAPNLSGDRTVLLADGPDGSRLVGVSASWCLETWFDVATGERRPEPEDSEDAEAPDEPWLFADEARRLRGPEGWEEPDAEVDGRYVVADARGIAVIEPNPAAAAGEQAESGDVPFGDAWFRPGTRGGTQPLTYEALVAAFDADGVHRFGAADLADLIEHEPTRTLLTDVGLPSWWAAGMATFNVAKQPVPLPEVEPETPEPSGPALEDLVHLGTFEIGYGDRSRLCVHRGTGRVYLHRKAAGAAHGPVFPLVRDVAAFAAYLEGVQRFMGACWDPYPGETGAADFAAEMTALDPDAMTAGTPAYATWEHFFAGITQLGVDGY